MCVPVRSQHMLNEYADQFLLWGRKGEWIYSEILSKFSSSLQQLSANKSKDVRKIQWLKMF